MTKILNLALKINGVVGRVAHTKSSDLATPKKIWNVHLPPGTKILVIPQFSYMPDQF